jgi:nitrate/nitrite-specific signal transduction histidine kinase
MPHWGHGDRVRADEIPVRLHDVATSLAIGISLLKSGPAPLGMDTARGTLQVLALLEDSLAQLRTVTAATAGGSTWQKSRPQLAESIRREASRLRIRLELDLSGKEDRLAPNLADMIVLVSREGLRNVRRHAGASACKITIHLESCPFSVRIRDWGAGLGEGWHRNQASGLTLSWSGPYAPETVPPRRLASVRRQIRIQESPN